MYLLNYYIFEGFFKYNLKGDLVFDKDIAKNGTVVEFGMKPKIWSIHVAQ